jgi:hypothetical protein
MQRSSIERESLVVLLRLPQLSHGLELNDLQIDRNKERPEVWLHDS